jgi:pilus assembly protein Flp/PilA
LIKVELNGKILIYEEKILKVFIIRSDEIRRPLRGVFKMKNKFIEFLKDEEGQTSTEYILLVAIVALVVIKFGDKLKTKLLGMVDGVFSKADGALNEFD